jgi:type II secretion system protein E
MDKNIVPIKSIPAKVAIKYKLVPVSETDDEFVIAMVDDTNLLAIQEVELLVGKPVRVIKESHQYIEENVKKYYGVGADVVEKMSKNGADILSATREIEKKIELSEEEMARDASLIQFVNQIFVEAFRERASDIHIEPFEKDLQIRYRVDGVLHEIPIPPEIKPYRYAIISRIKIMADMDITERRLPQDGRIGLVIDNHQIDCRVSTIPIQHGESVVIRLLDKTAGLFSLEDLGMLPDVLAEYEKLLNLPYGIILDTGPTGSGKTTTLYASLVKLNSKEDKIITIEDPVEYEIKGINQIQVNPQIGLTFANGLRHIVRQDPDIIMVGEIRDRETAEISIHSALTGHLVFSTVHTNDAPSTITRLIDMGIEPFLVASSIEGIMAQRLVRKICPNCKEEYKPSVSYLKEIGFPKDNNGEFPKVLYRGKGCAKCRGTGYYGRTGIFELLRMNDVIRDLVLTKTPANKIKEVARKQGMRTLREDGFEKVRQGITSIEEVITVTQIEEEII